MGVATIQIVIGGPWPSAAAGFAVGLGVVVAGYLPLRRLARDLVVTDTEIVARSITGAGLRVGHDAVVQVLVPGPASEARQALIVTADGRRLLVVRSGRDAAGFDAILRRHPGDTPTIWQTIRNFPRYGDERIV